MRQREGHFVHLAEETAVLKDQVDALRELYVSVLKDESISHHRSNSFPPSAIVIESPVRSQSNISFKSEDNNLEKEMLANSLQMSNEPGVECENLQQQQNNLQQNEQNNRSLDELEVTQEKLDCSQAEDSQSQTSEGKLSLPDVKQETTQLMISNSPKSAVKVSGTLKLMAPFEVQKSYKKFGKKKLEYHQNSKQIV